MELLSINLESSKISKNAINRFLYGLKNSEISLLSLELYFSVEIDEDDYKQLTYYLAENKLQNFLISGSKYNQKHMKLFE